MNGPDKEPVNLSLGFYINAEGMSLRIEDSKGKIVGEIEMSRRNLGSLLAGQYGIPAQWKTWSKK